MAQSIYITANSEFEAVSNPHLTMTIHAVNGDVIIQQEVSNTFVGLGTVTAGTAEIFEYGRFGKTIRLVPANTAQIEIR